MHATPPMTAIRHPVLSTVRRQELLSASMGLGLNLKGRLDRAPIPSPISSSSPASSAPPGNAPTWMDADQKFAKVVAAFTGNDRVTYGGGTGFGSGALKTDGKIFAMISSKGVFVVKLPKARVDALVAKGAGERFDP